MNFIKKSLIQLALTFLLSFVDKLKFLPLQAYLSYLGSEVQQVVELVLDSDKDDKGQLKQLWEKEKNGFIANTTATTVSFADTVIKDNRVKYVVVNLLRDIQNVLTNDGVIVPGSQLEKYFNTIDFKKGHVIDTPNEGGKFDVII